jgi:hypothetical protein
MGREQNDLWAKQFAEKVDSSISGAEAHIDLKALIAALKRCATQNRSFFCKL